MPSPYQRYYANHGIVAYAQSGDLKDHLFVLAGPSSAPATYPSLGPLIAAWSSAGGNPKQRTLLFCQSFDTATLPGLLDQLVTAGIMVQFWDKLVYWHDKTFASSGSPRLFPDASPGLRVLAEVGDLRLRLESGPVPGSLSDFAIAASADEKDLTLELVVGGTAWSIDGVAGSNELLTVALDAGSGYAAGSIGLDIPWMATNDRGAHPLARIQIAYVAPPENLPPQGDDPVPCQAWRSRVAHKVIPSAGSGAFCSVHIDPRDSVNYPRWLADEKLNSRILFGDAEIHSTFFSVTGDRFHLTATNGAAARVSFLHDMIDADGTVTSMSGSLVFHPEGLFAIKGSAPALTASAAADLSISRRDFVAGSATTEFFELGDATDVTHIEFVARQPGFLRRDETGSPIDRDLLGDGKGAVLTSHVRFAKAGTPTDVKFHSQSAEAPLFVALNPDHLQRRRKEYGIAQKPLPVFPHAGYIDGANPYEDFARFELSHLAQYRRKHAPPKAAPLHLATADATELAVTPQGILAEVAADGTSYARLYFGNPDSADNTKIDFALTINNTEARIFRDFQQALLSPQLFVVLRKPSPEALNAVTPSATLYARAFSFKILATEAGPFTETSMLADAILFKYYKGKSIADLLADQTTWACQPDLAPEGNSKLDTWSPFPKDQPVSDHLNRLKEVWDDKDWQGVLVLNFPLKKPPLLIEALKPGLAKKDSDEEPELRAPYFGLNALPATKSDLTSDPAKVHRPGSAFGMIRYTQKEVGKEPKEPATDDVEPGANGDGGREYRFLVDSLQITFENSQIAYFSAKLFIHFSHLFWDSLSPTGALQNLELDGYYERRGTEDVFSLLTRTPLVVNFPDDSYLKQFTITRAQLGVVASDDTQLTAFIGIDGTLQLSEKLPQIPLFSVKQIRLSSFGFEYSFARPKLSEFKFRFKPSGISADIDFGQNGAPSLLSLLPVKLKGMSIALGQLLDLGDLHFSPINFGGLGTKFQFGFLMELDFGSLGQLAGDLRGLKLPMLIGWSGGSSKGLAFGIQFPTREGKGIDIGIQQFIRLRAKELNLKVCKDAQGNTQLLAIQAVNARIVMLGKEWPEADTSFAIFIPVDSGRKPSWAFGLKKGSWYVGGGYRLKLPSANAKDINGVVSDFEGTLGGGQDVCSLVSQAASANDNWSVVGRYAGELKVAVAISDPTVYGIAVEIAPFGELDVMYRRVNSQLGIFSIEYTLPGALRTMQIGVASVRLPVFRLEIHTDGGFLADFGFPWNNDFSRSCQVEIAIFLGSGGFYYGKTSAAAADLLAFDGGYGFLAPDNSKLNELRTLRLGFAARVGIGRSFIIGILYAEASVTLFGGLEGAIAYRPGADLFSPTLYALKGYVGLMLDIRATVDFSIIRASAHILAYVEVGLEIRRVLGMDAAGKHHILTLPVVIFAEIALNVGVDVQIHVGCVDITIHLSFSTTWHYEEALAGFRDEGAYDGAGHLTTATPLLVAAPLISTFWNPTYRYWSAARDINLYVTVLPCMASAADVGESGDVKTCAVGTILLQVDATDNAFADLALFLVGWVLLPPGTSPAATNSTALTLGAVNGIREELRKTDNRFWNGFAAALLAIVPLQFVARLTTLASGQTDIFATLPLWPGVSFRYAPISVAVTAGTPVLVTDRKGHQAMTATDAAFAEYCRHLIAATIPEIGQLIEDKGYVRNTDGTVIPNASLPRKDPRKSMTWAEVWQQMFLSL